MDLRKLSEPTNTQPKQPAPPKQRAKTGGRKKGSVNKRTLEKIALAEREVKAAYTGKKLAIDHADDMIEYFRQLVALHQPWLPDGSKREGRDAALWFRCVEVFKDFIALRAPYQSPRLSAVAIMPQQARQRTIVNVTILNEKGDKVWSDAPDEGEDARLIEHGSEADDAAA